MTTSRHVPPHAADVVVIGGGIMGLSAAYHLAKAGVERVVLVERGALGEGSTCKAAGGVRALFSDEINIKLGQRSLETFERFGTEFGQEIDLRQVGYLFLLDDEADLDVFTENAELQNALGVPSRIIDVAEAKRLSPLIDTDGLVGALFSPNDGHCTPESVVLGYASAARRAGARLITGCAVTGIETRGAEITAVRTDGGTIRTGTVVCTAGAWAKQVGAWAGVELPVEPLRRQIVITEPVPGLGPDTPFTIDFSTSFYFHNEGQGLLLGMSERTDSWGFDLSRDTEWLADLAEAMARRVSSLGDVGIPGADVLAAQALNAARRCGVDAAAVAGDAAHRSPVNGGSLGGVAWTDGATVDGVVTRSQQAFLAWRKLPAPARGAVVKRFGELLTQHKADIGELISLEVGKITSEALGEVQEMIDICDFAVGLSRQLYGRTAVSERPGHRLMETWHPLGVVGVISAFNFPAAVWSWNTAIALVCGDTVVWKPSEQAPLTAWASAALLNQALAEADAPRDVSQVVVGGPAVGEALVDHPGVALVSATGSTRMGRAVGPRVANRFGRSLLELGGNNAAIVAPSADLDLTMRGIVFSAAGTAGQRCTTMRRVIAQRSIADELTERLVQAYSRLPTGNPMNEGTLVGPLVNEAAYEAMASAIKQATGAGGTLVAGGGRELADAAPDAYYARPAIVRMPAQTDVVRAETFAPLLYVLTYDDLHEAIALNNDVPQGLSSSLFTRDQAEAEIYVSDEGSDCGIVNVNIGTSGAEIGGAFGGEKETGGGRESGSDAWRGYMRRATNTINYSGELPLAQGVDFSV